MTRRLHNRRRIRQLLGDLRRDTSGLAFIEFAFSLPVLVVVGLYGAEVANLAVATMRVNQVALHVADNGSRIGEQSLLSASRIYESDINDLFVGADKQAGSGLDIYEHGRVIMSSLEQHSDGDQYISWQRCMGKKEHDSTFGEAGEDADDRPTDGMGPDGAEVTAPENQSVIFVEVEYDYQPLISDRFVSETTLRSRAAFNVRDNRDLTQIYDRTGSDPIAECDVYEDLG
jgi:hypothetical protein